MNDLPATFDPQTGEITRARSVQTFAPDREVATTHSMSADIGALALALAKAQAEVKGALKDADNPFFKSKYADLDSAWKACREALSKNELAVIQTPFTSHNNVGVVTILAHSSGQWIQGRIDVPPAKYDAQSAGSTITYLRRYALMAMVGIAPEDDDGNQASGRGGRASATGGPQPVSPPAQAAAPPSYTQEEYATAKAVWQPLVAAIKSATTAAELTNIDVRFADGLAAIRKVSATQAEQIALAIKNKFHEIAQKAGPFDADADSIPL